jgi:tripartite-type tricarboxylate transporter receptor subunit TctC
MSKKGPSIRRRPLLGAAGLLLAGAIARPVRAANAWPSRPIKLIVPSSPGAGSDLLARAMADRLGAALRQQVIVDNKPGGNGLIATRAVISAPADGYTLLYSSASATVMLAAVKPDLGIDFTRDLIPVAVTVLGGVFLLVSPDFPAKNLQELIAAVKSHPDRYTYGSWGIGSNGHLTMEWLKNRTGMQIAHVPYKTMSTILTELSTGILPVGWTDPVSSVSFIQAGKVRAIAVNGSARTPQLPDLPTMGEQGYPFPALGWQGIFAPAGTPPAITGRLHDEVNRIQATAQLKTLMVRMNTEPPPIWTSQQFRELIVRDLQEWKKIARDANVTLD